MKTRIYFVLIVVLFTVSCSKSSTSPENILTAPSNLTLEQINLESIRLNWQDNSSAEDGFRIDRKIGENEWEENYQILPENTTTFTDSELVAIGNYSYRISAYSNDDYSDIVEANINFFYNEVVHITAEINYDPDPFFIPVSPSIELLTRLLDVNWNLIEREHTVWFKILNGPEGMNINNTLYGIDDSLSVQAQNGQVVVCLNAGSESGIAAIKTYVYNFNNEEISITNSNILINTNIPVSVEFSIGEINTGANMGNGSWEIEVSALLLDNQGNPICDGTAVYFSLPNNPEWISIQSFAYTGNVNANGDSIPGVAFTRLTYHGSHTNETINVRLELGIGNIFEEEFVLPIQFPVIDIMAVPLHIDWDMYNNPMDWRDHSEALSPYIGITVIDGQNNLISNQEIIFTTTLGTPVIETQFNMSPTNPSFTPAYSGITDENGYLKRYFRFYKYECPEPIPSPPGTTTGTITAQIVSTNTSNQVTVILRRYID